MIVLCNITYPSSILFWLSLSCSNISAGTFFLSVSIVTPAAAGPDKNYVVIYILNF